MTTMIMGRERTAGISFAEVLERIEQDSRGKQDFLTPINNLRATPEGRIAFLRLSDVQGDGTKDLDFEMTNWAERQLLNRLGMPAAYFQKARQEDPELFTRHFNHWAAKTNGVTRLRTKVTNSTALIRGAVSDKYAILDNEHAIGNVMAGILRGKEDQFRVVMFHLDDHRLHLRIVYVDLTRQVGTLADGTPDYMQIGQDVLNSEVGAASFNLTEMIWRLVCSNGLRRWEKGDNQFVQRHIHLRPIEFQARVADAMVSQLQTGQEFLRQIEATQAQRIADPFAAITKLAQEGGFSNQFIDNAKEAFEGDATAYGVINSFTRAARELPNERRLEAEKFAGKLVAYKPSQWERINTVEIEV